MRAGMMRTTPKRSLAELKRNTALISAGALAVSCFTAARMYSNTASNVDKTLLPIAVIAGLAFFILYLRIQSTQTAHAAAGISDEHSRKIFDAAAHREAAGVAVPAPRRRV